MKNILLLLLIAFITVNAQEVKIVCSGFLFPEGPAWDGSKYLYVSNCYGDWISRILDQTLDTLMLKPSRPFDFGKTNGLVVYKNGDIYACDYGSGSILRLTSNGSCFLHIEGYDGIRFNRPNDLAFDAAGNLYFTDPKSYDQKIRDGRLFARYQYDNRTVLLSDTLAFPNGLAFSADGQNLYICESALNRVLKYSVKEDGTLAGCTPLVYLPGGDPDGIAVDRTGNLYIAHFGGGKVYVISLNGEILREIQMPGQKPTNVEFGGLDLRTLYITEVETNSLYSIRVSTPGLKLFCSP